MTEAPPENDVFNTVIGDVGLYSARQQLAQILLLCVWGHVGINVYKSVTQQESFFLCVRVFIHGERSVCFMIG